MYNIEIESLGYEYTSKVFDTFYDLTIFLNKNNISKNAIINISVFSRGIALVYLADNREVTNVEDTNEYKIGYKTGYVNGQKDLSCDKRFSEEHIKKLIDKAKREGYEVGHAEGYKHQQEEWENELAKHKQDGYDKGYYEGYDKCLHSSATDDYEKGKSDGYNRGLEECGTAIDRLMDFTVAELEKEFGTKVITDVWLEDSIQDIIAITKAHEEKKKDEEIIKGDTVCYKNSPNITFIVWDILDEADEGIFLYGFNKDGTYSSVNIKNVKKVNVPNCYSEVPQLLDKLKGEEK